MPTADTVVARLRANDPDVGDRLTYRLADDADGRFRIDADRGLVTLADGAAFWISTRPTDMTSRSQVTDSGGLVYQRATDHRGQRRELRTRRT